MNEFVPGHIARLAAYEPGRSAEQVARELGLDRIVKLASNERSSGASPRAIEAAIAALSQTHLYPDGTYEGLRAALAERLGVSADEVVVGNGSNELIELAFRTFTTPRDHVVFADPSFAIYRVVSDSFGIAYSAVPMRDGFLYDVPAMLRSVRPETRLVLVATPNNPTGTYLPRQDLETLLRGLPEHVVPVVDEAYFEFYDADDAVDAMTLRALHPNLLVLRTFSKAYGLAALRVGYGVGPAALVGLMQRVRPPFNVNRVAEAAACAALDDAPHLAAYLALNRVERSRVSGALARLGFAPVASQANFVLVGRFASGRSLFEAMMKRGVIVRPMHGVLSDYVRITIGTPEANDVMLSVIADEGARLVRPRTEL